MPRQESRKAGENYFIVFPYMLNSSISLLVTTTVAPTTPGPSTQSGITETDSCLRMPDPGRLDAEREWGTAGLSSLIPRGILQKFWDGGRVKIHTALAELEGLNSNVSSPIGKAKDDVKSMSISHAWAHQEQGEGR